MLASSIQEPEDLTVARNSRKRKRKGRERGCSMERGRVPKKKKKKVWAAGASESRWAFLQCVIADAIKSCTGR